MGRLAFSWEGVYAAGRCFFCLFLINKSIYHTSGYLWLANREGMGGPFLFIVKICSGSRVETPRWGVSDSPMMVLIGRLLFFLPVFPI